MCQMKPHWKIFLFVVWGCCGCLTNDHVWCEERESAAHASHHCQAWLDMAPGPGPYSHNLVSATHCIAPIINPAPAVTASIYSFFSQYKTVFRSTRHHLKRIFSRVESELMSRSGGTSLRVVGAEWKREWLVSRPVLARGQASCDWSVVSHVTAILSCDWSAELSSGWSGVLQHTDMISIHEPWLCINISQNNLIKNMQCSCLHRINNISFIMSLIAHQMNEKLNTCQSDEFIWIKFHFSCNWRFLLWPVAFKYDHNSLSAHAQLHMNVLISSQTLQLNNTKCPTWLFLAPSSCSTLFVAPDISSGQYQSQDVTISEWEIQPTIYCLLIAPVHDDSFLDTKHQCLLSIVHWVTNIKMNFNNSKTKANKTEKKNKHFHFSFKLFVNLCRHV